MDYSLLVGVHHKELGDAVDMNSFPRKQQQQQQQSDVDDEDELDERGRRRATLRRDDGGVQGLDQNEARDV